MQQRHQLAGCPLTHSLTGMTNQQNDERTWVAAAQQGDQQAFRALANKYKPLLIQFLLPYTHIREDAEDLCQEALQRAYSNINTYNSQYAFSTWLFNIARNAAIDHYRQKNASVPVIPQNWAEMASETGRLTESPEEAYIRDQTRKHIHQAIQQMPELYRDAARLRFIKEYAYEEIARQLNLPLNTVRTRIRRAREILLQTFDTPNDPKL